MSSPEDVERNVDPFANPDVTGLPLRPPAVDRTCAFLDIGTNSVRLLLVRIMANGSHRVLSEQKEVVRLGENEFADGLLRPAAMRRAVLVVGTFRQMAETYQADEIIAIATSATREARNQSDFLRMLRQEAGVEVRTISGREEARLIYLGVVYGLDLGEEQALFIDIGGGSTELIVGDQHAYHHLESLKLGAIRLSSLFFMPDETAAVRDDRYALIQRYVRNSAVRAFQRLSEHTATRVIGSSGTIQNLVEMARRAREEDEDPLAPMSLDELRALRKHLCSLTLEERRMVPGINAARADLIIAGAAILETIMDALGLEAIEATDRGLREGLIADYVARRHPEMDVGQTVRERSVLRLGRRCQFDEAHGRHVAHLSGQLFDSAREAGLHAFGSWERELLQHAAMLHDVGTFLSYDDHHRHSYYLIEHADLLGFDHTEATIVAALARFHRKGLPRKKHPEYRALPKPARGAVRTMAVFIRLAEALDRSHAGLVDEAKLRAVDGDEVVLEVRSESDCRLELWGAESHRSAFERTFERRLVARRVGHVDAQPTRSAAKGADAADGGATTADNPAG